MKPSHHPNANWNRTLSMWTVILNIFSPLQATPFSLTDEHKTLRAVFGIGHTFTTRWWCETTGSNIIFRIIVIDDYLYYAEHSYGTLYHHAFINALSFVHPSIYFEHVALLRSCCHQRGVCGCAARGRWQPLATRLDSNANPISHRCSCSLFTLYTPVVLPDHPILWFIFPNSTDLS